MGGYEGRFSEGWLMRKSSLDRLFQAEFYRGVARRPTERQESESGRWQNRRQQQGIGESNFVLIPLTPPQPLAAAVR